MKKVKFNVVDVVIILVVAAVAAGGFLYAKGLFGIGGAEGSARPTVATYQVEFTGKEKYVADLPKAGDEVAVGVKEKAAAVVTDVAVKPARRITYDVRGEDSGSAQWTEIPNEYDLTLTLQSEAVETDTEISASGVPLRVGKEAVVHGKGYAGSGYILSVETEDEGALDNE